MLVTQLRYNELRTEVLVLHHFQHFLEDVQVLFFRLSLLQRVVQVVLIAGEVDVQQTAERLEHLEGLQFLAQAVDEGPELAQRIDHADEIDFRDFLQIQADVRSLRLFRLRRLLHRAGSGFTRVFLLRHDDAYITFHLERDGLPFFHHKFFDFVSYVEKIPTKFRTLLRQ